MNSAMQLLAALTLAASVAVLLVMLLRKPLRRAFGAKVAYWLWLLVPASQLAVLLPPPAMPAAIASRTISDLVISALPPAVNLWDGEPVSAGSGAIWLAAWMCGSLSLSIAVARRQRASMRMLRSATAAADGTRRSGSVRSPVLVGLWRPAIVVPPDFESRYTQEERAFVLAHERAHWQRGDLLVSAIATMWLCLFWFNPLAHWAIGRLRFDQDLACDAVALAVPGVQRRRYADALLKAQLADDTGWPVPAGCHWRRSHPLKERIVMLKHPLPSARRAMIGTAMACAFAIAAGYMVWLGMPRAHEQVLPGREEPAAGAGVSREDAAAPDCTGVSGPCLGGNYLLLNVTGRIGSPTTMRFTARSARGREDGLVVELAGAEITRDNQLIRMERAVLDVRTGRVTADTTATSVVD